MNVFAILADTAVKGSLVLAVAAAAAWMLRRRSAAARHLVWTAAATALLALPFLSVTVPELRIVPAAQEGPRQWIGFQSAARKFPGHGEPSCGETCGNWFAKFVPELHAELPGSQPFLAQVNHACADRFRMQPPEHPNVPAPAVVTHRGQRLGELDIHHPDWGKPLTEFQCGYWRGHLISPPGWRVKAPPS